MLGKPGSCTKIVPTGWKSRVSSQQESVYENELSLFAKINVDRSSQPLVRGNATDIGGIIGVTPQFGSQWWQAARSQSMVFCGSVLEK